MAFDAGHDRTEEATPKRREEPREQGQLAVSQELTGGLLVMGGLIGLLVFGRQIGGGLLDLFRTELPRLWLGELDMAEARTLIVRAFERLLWLVGSLLALLMAVAVGANVAQVGLYVTPDRLGPDFDRLNPAHGLKRLGSLGALGKGVIGLLKVVVFAAIGYVVVSGRMGTLTTLGRDRLAGAAATGWDLALRLAIALGAALLAFGAWDYFMVRRRHEAGLRMTRQEIKEEMKRDEGDPLVKQRIRQLQRERARQRMMAAVPKATVVVTNPTHLAVALEYKQAAGSAPTVVAKGAGFVAKRIAQVARRHGVPVIERPVVARALFKVVPVGGVIPTELFRVVAEIIALVYRWRTAA